MKETLEAFERLMPIMDELREKCPWDRKQTIESIRYLTIEETYELSDAILKKDLNEVKKELGDLMLHMVFYSKIASEGGHFTMKDVLDDINEKLVNRHPHVYGDTKVENAEEVKDNWEQIKLSVEKRTTLGGVPNSLPALLKAYRVQDKARGVGFDWEKPHQVWDKVIEEMGELKEEIKNKDQERIEAEFGDLLFALINYARFIDVNPEDALTKTTNRFMNRFNYLEKEAGKIGKSLKDMSLAEMDVYWEEAKKMEGDKK
jgi:XTP/dITP diphosphohydrolase